MTDLLQDFKILEWYAFGIRLTDDVDTMNLIKKDHQKDSLGALEAIFQHWLQTCPESKCRWETVVETLKDIGEISRACELEEKYVTCTLSSHKAS